MGHDYGVPLRFLSVTPTRDNEAAPGNRLVDKHVRLFHGKTLDEWLMLQLWSSKYLGRAIFVCETEAHQDKLWKMSDKYGVDLLVRPREMLHPLNDTGGLPIIFGVQYALAHEYYSLITTPLVVSPCRPPGFFDNMVEQYLRLMPDCPDQIKEAAWIMGAYDIDGACFEIQPDGYAKQLGEVYLNKVSTLRFTTTQHWLGATWWYLAHYMLVTGRHDVTLQPKIFDIEPWTDIHIDTQEQWDWAEYWFGKKGLNEEGYYKYRELWQGQGGIEA